MASSISAGTTSSTALVCTADTTGALQLATNNGTVAVTIDTSQNVGIGTSSPVTNLTISSASGAIGGDGIQYVQAVYTGTGTTNAGYTAKNYYGTSQFFQWNNNGTRLGNRIITNSGGGNLVFTYNNDSEGMRITSAGVVQVGNNAGTGEVFAQNTVKVWGAINSGSVTFYNSFGASSVSKISTGVYAIGFTRTLASSRFGSAVSPYGGGFGFVNTESTTGCRINLNNTSNTYVDGDSMFLIAGGS
jgi:hypothetical protein